MQIMTILVPDLANQVDETAKSFYQTWWFAGAMVAVILLFTGLEVWRRRYNKSKQAEIEKGRQQINKDFQNPGGKS